MAFNNRPKKKVSMYFEGMERKFGKDWLVKVSPVEILKRADIFFKDLAYGSIDKTLYGYVFDNPLFMNTMINESYNKYEIEFMECHAFETYAKAYPMRTQESLYNHLLMVHNAKRDACAYINIKLHEMTQCVGSEKLIRLDLISNHLKSIRHSL